LGIRNWELGIGLRFRLTLSFEKNIGLTLDMRTPLFGGSFLLAVFLFQAAAAQEPVRAKNPVAYPTRDSLSKKAIEEQYDAEINKCRSQISTLNKEIVQLDQRIQDLEMAAKQAEKDYITWAANYDKSPGRKDPQAKMWKQYELQKKLNGIAQQIEQCRQDKKMKQIQIHELQLLRAKLEKDKAALLNKLD
jgi:hypothetical protein